MSNRRERRKNRMGTRICRLFELTNLSWLAPNIIEAWPECDPDAVYIRMHGTSYTVIYKRGGLEWTGNKLRDAAKLFKASRLLVV